MGYSLNEVFSFFHTTGTFKSGESYGNGHIHDTFRIETLEPEKDNYILQRLNDRIFHNIPQLQNNIERVTVHLRNRLMQIPGSDIKRECLQLVPAHVGKTWVRDDQGNSWRMYVFIPDHKSYSVVESADMAFEAGKAIGKFQAMLSDLPGGQLYETIPDFHNIEKRLENFKSVVQRDPVKRAGMVSVETEKILRKAEEMRIILNLGRESRIPLRITHNDTKFNNILLDEKNKALCVIDLDTVMPGYIHYDFGDAIRTVTNPAPEDEKDLSRIDLNLDFFRAYSEGYLSETSDMLNETEKEYLPFAPILITYTIAVRFLTDYIDGDNYFKIHHEHHNLQRACAQLRLVSCMEERYSDMKKIIRFLTKRST